MAFVGIKNFYPYVLISLLSVYFSAHVGVIITILKVTPIVYLILYMVSHLRRPLPATTRSGGSEESKRSDRVRLAKGVTYGLGFCLVGDIFLTVFFNALVKQANSDLPHSDGPPLHLVVDSKDVYYLIGGVIGFGVGQICYIYAFGFRVVRPKTGLVLYVVTGVLSVVVLWGLPVFLKVLVTGYAALLITSVWRALDRSKLNDGRSWVKKVFLPVGLVTFFMSDLWIGFSTFVLTDRHASSVYVIMATYYIAQGLIASAAS